MKHLLNKVLTHVSVICLPIIIISCGSGLRQVELFYAGKNSTMYYIRPFTIKGDDGDAEMDITYRHHESKDSSRLVSCKFTFFSEKPGIEKVKSAYFQTNTDTTKIYLNSLDRFFVERDNDKARYEGKIQYEDLKKIFTSDEIFFFVTLPSGAIQFGPKGSVEKVKLAIRREMIELIGE